MDTPNKPKKGKQAAELRTVEEHHAALDTPAWLAASAKQKHGWAVGYTLDEDAYLECLKAAADEPIGQRIPEGHEPADTPAESKE